MPWTGWPKTNLESPLTRREALRRVACGFGYLAFAGMSASAANAAGKLPHFRPKAKRVIFIFMQGGPSHVDTFDHKPVLFENDGKMAGFDDARTIANTGARGTPQRVMKPLWTFARHGQCGRSVSQLFPHMARHVDDLCFIHSMQTEGVAHGPATLFLHCGSTNLVRPSMGSWITYGLGTENDNLPGFVTLGPPGGNGGARNYGSAFLPAAYQGTAIGKAGAPAREATIQNLTNPLLSLERQRAQFDLLNAINAEQLRHRGSDSELEAVVGSFELAWRMQSRALDVLDTSKESPATLAAYGIGEKHTDDFGRRCLMARRLSEAGVRYVQITYGDNTANPAWDQHSNLEKHAEHARAVDKPVAGLLADLKQRGLWRTPLSGGEASSAARPTRRKMARAATITPVGSPSGSRAAA